MSRRGVLGLAAVAALAGTAGLAGCTGGSARPGSSPTPDPLAPVLAGTEAVISLYAATAAAQPTLAAKLEPLLAEHRAHAAALRSAMGLSTPSGAAGGAPSAAGSAGSSTVAVPDDPAAALAKVANAERAAHASAVKDCLASRPAHAGLLGSIAASRACHLEVLG